jgi:riboflavin kinase/FMN adenylyltransferase
VSTLAWQGPMTCLCSGLVKRSVLTVGNFDGVHLAHQALLAAAKQAASADGLDVVVLCFERHPANILRPDAAPKPLMDPAQREAALMAAGADRVVILPANEQLLGLEAETFVAQVVAEHRPSLWMEGPDFRFGKGRAGNMERLKQLGTQHGFDVQAIDPVDLDLRSGERERISSTLIRSLVGHGRVAEAQRCLGRAFAVAGQVVRGAGEGRSLGFPTANLQTDERLLPADGVYAGWTLVDDRPIPAAISVGTRPTYGEHARLFEAHLIDFSETLYDQRLEVRLNRWLRDQERFESVDDLVEQMNRDVDRVRGLHDGGLLIPDSAATS